MLYCARTGNLEGDDIAGRHSRVVDFRGTLKLDSLAVPEYILVALGRICDLVDGIALAGSGYCHGDIRSKGCCYYISSCLNGIRV